MATIFCPDCGAKAAYTLNKPKFCQTCGIKFGEVSTAAETHETETEEEVPHLDGLDYSIEMERAPTTLGNLLDSPLDPANVAPLESPKKGRSKKHIPESRENFLVRSVAECASSRQQPAISEDGAK